MSQERKPPLGIPPAVLSLFLVSLVTTVAIALWQLHLRNDVGDVTQLKIFYYLFMMVDYPAALLMIAVLFVSLVPAVQRWGGRLLELVGSNPGRTVAVAWFGLAAGAYWVYHAYPLCMDEYAPYLQSRVFAAGSLVGRFPPGLVDWLVVPGFQGSFLFVSHEGGAVASGYWPGFALLLTPFTALGVPWLANPTVGAISLLAVHRIALELLQSRAAAALAMLLSLASPAFSINAMSFYSMPAHLLCNAAFVLLLLRPTPRRALAAGLVGGLALILHNPVPHLLFSIPWLVWLLTRKDRWMLVASIGVGYLPGVAAGFGWHHLLDSLAGEGGAMASAQATDLIGTVIKAIKEVVAMPGEGVVVVRAIGLSKVWLWAVPSMCIVAAVGYWQKRKDLHFRLLLASALLTLVGYLFVPVDQGHGWGFRYFHSAWFVLPIFAAAAFANGARPGAASQDPAPAASARFVHAATLGSLVVMTGFFAWQVHSFISRHLAQLPVAKSGVPRLLVVDPYFGYYAYDLIQNDPFLRGSPVIALTQGNERDAELVARYFPGLVRLGGDYRGTVWGEPASGK